MRCRKCSFYTRRGPSITGSAAHSLGDQASCLTDAMMKRGIPCHIMMRREARRAERDAVRLYGGLIAEYKPLLISDDATTTIADKLLVPLKELK